MSHLPSVLLPSIANVRYIEFVALRLFPAIWHLTHQMFSDRVGDEVFQTGWGKNMLKDGLGKKETQLAESSSKDCI